MAGWRLRRTGTIYASSNDYLTAVRPDGKQRWRVDVRELLVDGTLLTDGDGDDITPGGEITAPAVDDNDNVIVGVEDGRILAIGPDGDLEWTFYVSSSSYADGSSPVRGPALLDSGYCCIMLGADDGEVYQLDDDGRARGVRRARGAVTAAPASGPHGTVFWALACQGTVQRPSG